MNDNQQNTPGTDGGLAARIKESPRTVSALIIILIVAAAIYAFSDDQQNESGVLTENGAQETQEEVATSEEESEETAAVVEATPTPRVAADMTVTPSPQQRVEQLPPAQKTEGGYEETAQPGDGITHLARRATTRWLTENKVDFSLTPEHLIYVEDYIQNRIGTEGLELGAKKTIQFDLVKEAVVAAQGLNEQQLKNLSKYTSALNK